MRKLVAIALLLANGICVAQQTSGETLSGALHPRRPGLPDQALPVYLKAGSLICQKWQRLRDAAEDAAKASDADQLKILRERGCAVVPSDIQVSIVRTDQNSWDAMAEKSYGFAHVSWLGSNGIPDSGFVGVAALRN